MYVCSPEVFKLLQKRGKIINDMKEYNIQCGGRPKCAVVGEGVGAFSPTPTFQLSESRKHISRGAEW